MKNPKSLKFSPSSDEFEKILNNLKTLVEEQNIEVRKLNKKILPLKDELDSVLFKLKKLNSLLSPSFSLSYIDKPKDFSEDKKQLDDHIRGRVRFVINDESINIPVYVGEIKKLTAQYPGVKVGSDDWNELIQRIALEKSYTRLKELKPGIFDPYLV